MRLASFTVDGRESWGVVEDEQILDLGAEGPATLRAALAASGGGAPAIRSDAARLALSSVTLLPPIPDPGRIICIGRNYLDHLAEGKNKELPTSPDIFLRLTSSLVAHGAPVLRGPHSVELDYEGELAVVIGKPGRAIPRDQALEHVLGYSCFMDGTMRDFQARHRATVGKNFPQTGGFGPWIVTAEEVGDPAEGLELTTRLNGTVMQHSATDRMIFSVAEIIAFVSIFTPLSPGDVLITGTPEGIGRARKPPVWMQPGDVIEVEIAKVGTLRNPIAAE